MKKSKKTESAGPWTGTHDKVFKRAHFICGRLLVRENSLRWFVAHELEDELGRCRMLLGDVAQLAVKDNTVSRDLLGLVIAALRTEATRFFRSGNKDPRLSGPLETWAPGDFTPWLSFKAYPPSRLAEDLGLTGANRVCTVLGVLCSTLRSLGALAYNCACLFERLQRHTIYYGEFATTVNELLNVVASLLPTLNAARRYLAIEEWNAEYDLEGGAE